MRKIGKKHHKNLAALIILLALSGAVIAGNQTGILNFVEYKLYDPRINFFAHRTLKSQDIILVLLDQESIENAQRERGWGWPWPRKAYADLLDYLNLGGAKSVSFDMLYSEPSIYRSINDNEDDASFARAAESYGRVVQGVLFSTQTGDVYSWPPDLDKPFFKTENFDSFISSFDLTNDYRGEETKVRGQFPIKELRDTAAIVGSVTGRSDTDHIYRRLRLFTIFDGKPVPSLGAAALLASGYDNTISYDSVKKLIRWGEYTVPVDDEGKTLLRFRGDPITRYPRYPMYDVLKSAEDYAAGIKPEYSPEDFNGTYVFVGVYGPGLYDIFPSPISSTYPGMGAHVTMLDNLLMGDFITKAPDWLAMVIIAGSVLLMVILVLYSGVIVVTIAGMVISIAALIIAGFLAFRAGWWIPMAAPIIAVSLSYLTATLYSYATEGKDKRFIKNAFSRILSPKVIDQIIADPSQLKLGGERRKMTAIFTDVQRFSTISSVLQDEYGED
ncbi:MAG: CHASE2 domain-containing protein, partial [Treponema sp.]|nr:CHASE2 domain-containing protein [Treponema sp.]